MPVVYLSHSYKMQLLANDVQPRAKRNLTEIYSIGYTYGGAAEDFFIIAECDNPVYILAEHATE